MNPIPIYKKGMTIPFSFNRDGQGITGWVCLIEVKSFPGDAADISRVIAAKDGAFSGFLTVSESDGLSVGTRVLTAKMTKSATTEEEHFTKRFHVSEPWI